MCIGLEIGEWLSFIIYIIVALNEIALRHWISMIFSSGGGGESILWMMREWNGVIIYLRFLLSIIFLYFNLLAFCQLVQQLEQQLEKGFLQRGVALNLNTALWRSQYRENELVWGELETYIIKILCSFFEISNKYYDLSPAVKLSWHNSNARGGWQDLPLQVAEYQWKRVLRSIIL